MDGCLKTFPPESKFAARDLSRSTPLTPMRSSFFSLHGVRKNETNPHFFLESPHTHARNAMKQSMFGVCPNHKQIIAFFHSIGGRKCFFSPPASAQITVIDWK
jgi:hypothetical protein